MRSRESDPLRDRRAGAKLSHELQGNGYLVVLDIITKGAK
jgi:hypothetical protein